MKVDLAKATAVPGITSPAPGLLSVQHPRLVQTFIMLVCVCVCVSGCLSPPALQDEVRAFTAQISANSKWYYRNDPRKALILGVSEIFSRSCEWFRSWL